MNRITPKPDPAKPSKYSNPRYALGTALAALCLPSLGLPSLALLPTQLAHAQDVAPAQQIAPAQQSTQADFVADVRQLTFEGSRAGEGYFSRDGKQMVFQSEREVGNPFYQIYLMDRESGDVERVSPGHGKTTCAWIHPDGDRVLFASTQFDSEATSKQQAELDFRASGQQRRYAWDYDPEFELVEWNRKSGTYKKLTEALGYDAEASYSPDGKLIAFSSNRQAYSKPLSER
jgi:Tol biopolymer transport system component